MGPIRVLVIESNRDLRRYLVEACLAQRISARGVCRIADIERWPQGQVVVTDRAHLTPLWREVGASAVIVLVDRPEEGVAGLANGATAWLPRDERRAVEGIVRVAKRLTACDDPPRATASVP